MRSKEIPAPLTAAIAELVAHAETHATLDSLFMHADASGDAPEGNKLAKAQAWLRHTNKAHQEPLAVAGKIICTYIEDPEMVAGSDAEQPLDTGDVIAIKRKLVRKIERVLAQYGLKYRLGGIIASGGMTPSKTLGDLIKGRDLPAIHREFDRALNTVDVQPRDAVSAAANVLESIFKTYIEDNSLPMPDKQDLQPVFKVVRADLGLDPGRVEDQDLQRIISGLISVVDGIGALRTHASSVHSEGRRGYKLEPRHSRLAVNAAHTVATFVMEMWDRKEAAKPNQRSAELVFDKRAY